MPENSSSPVETALGDLRSTVAALGSTSSPGEIRRLFSTFLSASQALTDYMRTEYKGLTGGAWEPKDWMGWNEVSELVKKLRRHNQHVFPLLLLARERYYYSVTSAADGPKLVVEGTWGPLDPQETVIPDTLLLHLADPITGAMSEQTIAPCKREVQLIPFADEPKLDAMLDKISDKDVRTIAESTLAVLEAYVVWYFECIREQHA